MHIARSSLSHGLSLFAALSLTLIACGSPDSGSSGTGGDGSGTGGTAGSDTGGSNTGGMDTAGSGGMGTGGTGTGGTPTGGSGGSTAMGCPGSEPIAEPAERLYVAPGGDDMAEGTKAAPLATLGEAVNRFPAGGTIVVRGGEYPHQVLADATGTADHPLVVRAEEGETPIFDGKNQTQDYRGTLHLTHATHVVLSGLEVRNATGSTYAAAISNVGLVSDLKIVDCHLHDINGPVARFTGDGLVFEHNHIHDAALMNSVTHTNWPTCMGTSPNKDNPSDPWTKNVVIRNNHIHDCWGEGIGLFYAAGALVEGNVVERTWNVGIYMDNASDVTVARNFVHMIDGMANNPGPGSTILMGMENYDMWGLAYQPTTGITVTNNVAIGRSGVGWFYEPNASLNLYFDDVTIAHNTFLTESGAIKLGAVDAGQPKPTKIVVRNNVIAEGKPSSSSAMFPEAFDVDDNAWLNEDLPPIAGAGDVSLLGVSLPANVTTATDLQPLVATVGSAGSSAGVSTDYLCTPRSATHPTRGAFEE